MKRVFVIVLDSCGIGFEPDAADFGDVGADTLRTCSQSPKFAMPNLISMGLGNLDGVDYLPKTGKPTAALARLQELSRGKDTTIGHWEIAGIVSPEPLPTFPHGFPEEVLRPFREQTGRGVLCNLPYSGTEVIKDYGREHVQTGDLIVYTSADSVFQIAAHESVVPPEQLYDDCRIARKILTGKYGVGRVIARPFEGEWPYTRTSNTDGLAKPLAYADKDFHGLCFVNLVDFDMLYGHRRNPDGYAAALQEFDSWLPGFLEKLGEDDCVIITADHGCDPGYRKHTDHTREYIPMIALGKKIRPVNLGTRAGFCDIAATVTDLLGVPYQTPGRSFAAELV